MDNLEENFKRWKENNELIFVDMMKQKKGRQRLYGRLLNYDVKKQYLQVYNDDEKSVYNVSFVEVDDIGSTKN
ncbi:hypothetical protein FZW96_16745 [Bacillus sp. BGMRC 2118]|nr:hypothetical protein FZW96_16745 [Bacillus sp. BGMRC 2118]